ncbi:RNA-dependent ATPase rok1 [Elasticomyces elasticus]|nr:RNA-dependent ATPase rok1 [Elasticomyces elasticus]
MDPFKLLSRSTTLTKRTANTVVTRLPSGGEIVNPQLFDGSPEDIVQERLASRKRKRDQNGAANPILSSGDVDFFGAQKPLKNDARQQPSEHAARKASVHSPPDFGNIVNSAARRDEGAPVLGEQESKQILKQHKVKITLLHAGTVKDPKSKNTKKHSKRGKSLASTSDAAERKAKVQLYPEPLISFGQLRSRYHISRRLAGNLDSQGYTVPTEVQLGSFPLLLDNCTSYVVDTRRSTLQNKVEVESQRKPSPLCIDLLSVAPTGSGKTLAFLIPVMQALLRTTHSLNTDDVYDGPRAVVLAPTKELVGQITNEGRKLAQGTAVKIAQMRKGMHLSALETRKRSDSNAQPSASEVAYSSRSGVTVGNELQHSDALVSDYDHAAHDTQVKTNEYNVVKADILVSTPLALLNAISNGESAAALLTSVQYLIFDEADVLLDPLFRQQTLAVWNTCNNPALRVSLWSATMGSNIEELAMSTIEERFRTLSGHKDVHLTRAPLVRLVVGLKDSAIPNIEHKLTYAATEQGKLMALRQLLHPSTTSEDSGPALRPPFMVFTQTIERAAALHSELLYDIPPEAGGSSRIAVLHSDLSDTARDGVMTRFRKGEVWVLITTDLLSRGVDFRGVNGVVNYDVPASGAAYVHRVGRTGRAGRGGGVAITLYTKEDIPYIKNIANVIAASERQKGVKANDTGIQQWLLDALPTPSKRDKQLLKKRGVEVRRSTNGKDKPKDALKTRISTKSGYERRAENNRRATVMGSRSRYKQALKASATAVADDSDFGGFSD